MFGPSWIKTTADSISPCIIGNRFIASAAASLTDSISEKSTTNVAMSVSWQSIRASDRATRTRSTRAFNLLGLRPSNTTPAPRFTSATAAPPPMLPVAPAISIVCLFVILIISTVIIWIYSAGSHSSHILANFRCLVNISYKNAGGFSWVWLRPLGVFGRGLNATR